MSTDNLAIRVRNLGKRYSLGGPQEKYHTFRDAIVNSIKSPFRKIANTEKQQEFWALKDVSFDVEQGEVVGIIGRNGAGKSTLLKILSRITTPTEGEIELYGRVGSLLEVGTGFHPEMTGRENIYLSGSILGMKRQEIDDKLDAIVKFSEIEKFLDTPAKRYSSGMYVRLAFAVAAHLEPEILLVDEVLAVGDAAFQKKCLGKMGEVAKEGRTVLFVSHNMAAVQQLCSQAVLIHQGHLVSSGKVNDIIGDYLAATMIQKNKMEPPGEFSLKNRINHYNNGKPIIQKILLLDKKSNIRDTFLTGETLKVAILVEGLSDINGSDIGVVFQTAYNQWVSSSATWMCKPKTHVPRRYKEWFILTIPTLLFTPGRWGIYVSATVHSSGIYLDKVENSVFFNIEGADVYGTGQLLTQEYGLFYLVSEWEIQPDTDSMNNTFYLSGS